MNTYFIQKHYMAHIADARKAAPGRITWTETWVKGLRNGMGVGVELFSSIRNVAYQEI